MSKKNEFKVEPLFMKRPIDPVKQRRQEKEVLEVLTDIKYSVEAKMKNYNFTHNDNKIDIKDVIHFLNQIK